MMFESPFNINSFCTSGSSAHIKQEINLGFCLGSVCSWGSSSQILRVFTIKSWGSLWTFRTSASWGIRVIIVTILFLHVEHGSSKLKFVLGLIEWLLVSCTLYWTFGQSDHHMIQTGILLPFTSRDERTREVKAPKRLMQTYMGWQHK